MGNVALTWGRPSHRSDGTPLGEVEVAAYRVELSADGGANFVPIGVTTAPDRAFTQTELEPGVYLFRVVAVDRHSPAIQGIPSTVSITVP